MSHDPFAPIEGNHPSGKPTAEQAQTVGDTVKAQQKLAEHESTQQQQAKSEAQAEVPRGTRAEVMDWVGSDKTKAKRALAAEKKSDQPRKTLVSELEGILEEK